MSPRSACHILARLLLLLSILLGGTLPVSHVAFTSGSDEPARVGGIDEQFDWGGKGGRRGESKVERALLDLADEHARAGSRAAMRAADTMDLKTQDESVLVVIEGEDGITERLRGLVESKGGTVTTSQSDKVQAYLPFAAMRDLAAHSEVKRVRKPLLPVLDVMSEGSSVIGAPAWQTAGVNGSGIKIGIIDAGYAGYASLVGTELPPAGRLHLQSFFPGGDITGGGQVHGTACAEIIYDLAPAADYYLANVYSDVDFGSAVDWMIANGVNIVSVSLGWAGANNYDGQGFLAGKVNAAKAAGIFWANSAGNQARRHWEGYFYDSDSDNAHNFTPTDEGNTIYVNAGTSIFGALTWFDNWNSPVSDYDLYLVRSSDNTPVATSEDVQGPGIPPSEIVSWVADVSGYYYFALVKYNDSGGPRYLELYTYRQDLEHQVNSSSLVAPADAAGAVTVGAFNWSTGVAENFSSQGPTNDGRVKPELSSPDGVSTSSYGAGQFYGTSAAAPHVAGAAALVKQAYPHYSPDQILSFLEGRAVDAGAAGKDNVYGSGRLNLGAMAPAQLALSSTTLGFIADPQLIPGTQVVSIANAGGGALTWTATESYPWLSLNATGGTAPSSLQVSVNKGLVTAGTTVSGQIRIDATSPPGTQSTPQFINVSFTHSATALPRVFLPAAAKTRLAAW